MVIYRSKKTKNMNEWQEKASKEELRLYNLMCKLQCEYFKDLTLNKFRGSEVNDNSADDIPIITLNRQHTIRIIELKEMDKTAGFCAQFKPKGKTIEFLKGQYEENIEKYMLHEMIHAYDYELKEYPVWRDYVNLHLYEKLRREIGKRKLWSMLNNESYSVSSIDSAHSMLFLFKSLDLDIHLKEELGTIFSYERNKLYRDL